MKKTLVIISVLFMAFIANAQSAYKLPFAGGITSYVAQGNGGSYSHNGTNSSYAWDFMMPIGTYVVASRAGTVRYIRQYRTDGARGDANILIIDHGNN